MSWNGNDLFNSTLMGGMPSGADPHQYLTTDGNGKPRWEDKLAYEESTVEVILPPTTVFSFPGKQTTLSVKAAKAINEGDTGVLTINDVDYPYTGIKGTASGLTDSIQLSTEGDANHKVYVNPVTLSVNVVGNVGCGYKDFTFSIVERSTTIKTLDPKYLPSGSGGGMLTVNFEVTMNGDESAFEVTSHSHSAQEILEAVESGMNVQASAVGQIYGPTTAWLPLAMIAHPSGITTTTIGFANMQATLAITVSDVGEEEWIYQMSL